MINTRPKPFDIVARKLRDLPDEEIDFNLLLRAVEDYDPQLIYDHVMDKGFALVAYSTLAEEFELKEKLKGFKIIGL